MTESKPAFWFSVVYESWFLAQFRKKC